jgi:hypothetical protein
LEWSERYAHRDSASLARLVHMQRAGLSKSAMVCRPGRP